MVSSKLPSFKKQTEQDRLGVYVWVKGYEKIIKYYPEHRRYACVHVQEHQGLIAATCVFCAERIGNKNIIIKIDVTAAKLFDNGPQIEPPAEQVKYLNETVITGITNPDASL